jgi:hypothetical protein
VGAAESGEFISIENVWTEMYNYCDPFQYESAIMSLSGRCASALLIVLRFIYMMATT